MILLTAGGLQETGQFNPGEFAMNKTKDEVYQCRRGGLFRLLLFKKNGNWTEVDHQYSQQLGHRHTLYSVQFEAAEPSVYFQHRSSFKPVEASDIE